MTIIHNSRHIVIPAMPGLRVHAPRGTASSNWWEVSGVTCVAAYQPKGAASYAASKTNLANPGTYDATDGWTYPTWDTSTGWTFIATGGYHLNTGVTPDETYTIIVRFSNAGLQVYRAMIGMRTTGEKYFFISASWASSEEGLLVNSESSVVFSSTTSGVLAIAGQSYFLDGDDLGGSGTADWGTTTPCQIIIGGININNTPQFHFSGDIQGVAIYSDTLTSTQVATVSAAMAAL